MSKPISAPPEPDPLRIDHEERRRLLGRTNELTNEFLDGVADRPVGRTVDFSGLVAALGGALPDEGRNPIEVIEHLQRAADPGVVATAGPRYFGFVVGGSLPAALAAEWLAIGWDQNAGLHALSPAAGAVEEVIRTWMVDLFGLDAETGMGLTTGGTMANFTGLAAGRHALLERVGWNVEEQGLHGAPPITVVTSDESHVSIFAALQMLGLGRSRVRRVATDDQGQMRADALRATLADLDTPVLVCAQSGNVNTGAFDPVTEIVASVRRHAHPGWLHVDGAFGLWAAVSPTLRQRIAGIELADSLSLDCHKWLNVPYDSGMALVRDAAALHGAMTLNAPYYVVAPGVERDNSNWVPEASRRARGFAIYAALRALGRQGLTELIDRCCAMARRMADRLAAEPGIRILNEVVLNQVLVRCSDPAGSDSDALTDAVIRRVQEEGTCWLGGTVWHGLHAMRISVSNWSTREDDIDRSAAAIIACTRALRKT